MTARKLDSCERRAARAILIGMRKQLVRSSDVARFCGVSPALVTRIAKGERAPSFRFVCRAARLLGLDAESLIYGRERVS